jgi:hypothetical protein
MNYELVKQLEEAGFCVEHDIDSEHPYCHKCEWYETKSGMEEPCVPTLSELIEACGVCLSHIKRIEDTWWAVSHCEHEEHQWNGNNHEECGVTPDEAVAKLYLALNSK